MPSPRPSAKPWGPRWRPTTVVSELAKRNVTKGAFAGAWYKTLAEIYGTSRNEIEQRERRRQILRRNVALGISVALIAVLASLSIWTLLERAEARRQQQVAQENEVKAKLQERLAKDNEQEAKRQEAIARHNEEEAKRQESIADVNKAKAEERRREAETQRTLALQQRDVALSRLLAAQSLKNGSEASGSSTSRFC